MMNGKEHTQETKLKISKALTGRLHPVDCQCSFHWKNTGKRAPSYRNAPSKARKQEIVAGRIRPVGCEVCGKTNRKICFDHEHSTGKFRGWLCLGCNATLGFAADDIGILRKLIAYLEMHKQHE